MTGEKGGIVTQIFRIKIGIPFYALLLGIAICFIGAPVVKASDDAGMSLEDLLNIKVTVASKTEQTVGDAPSSVTVITREEMKNMGVGSVEEMLNYIPGFVVSRNVTSFRKENVTVRGGRFYDILFLYNGQRINGLYQGGYSDGNQYIPIENIKQIEIIRGPGSALYGSNAFLGVVNIVTVDDVNEIYVAGGDMDRKEAAINASISNDALTVAGFVKTFSDLGYKYGKLTDSWGQEADARDPMKGTDISFTLKHSNFFLNARHNEVQLEDFIMFGNLGNGINDGKITQSHINGKYSHQMNDRLEFDVSTGFIHESWDVQFLQIALGKAPIAVDADGNKTLNDELLWGGPYTTSIAASLNFDARYLLSDVNSLITGFSLEYQKDTKTDVQAIWSTRFPTGYEYYGTMRDVWFFNTEEDRTIFGLYLQDQHQFGDTLNLTAGVRYDYYDDFGSSINPRAALVYTTPFQSNVKFMYGQAFRAPNRSELYDVNNRQWAGNDDLDAERVQTYELAYIQDFKFLQGGITYFNSKVTDKILAINRVEEGNPNSPKKFENLGTEKTKGIEIDLKIVPMKKLLITGTYLHFIDPDEDILFVPVNSGSMAITYSINRLSWSISGLYRESMKHVKNQGDYYLFNTNLFVNIFENVRLKGSIKNFTDEKYHTYTDVFEEGIINRGRTWTIGVECQI